MPKVEVKPLQNYKTEQSSKSKEELKEGKIVEKEVTLSQVQKPEKAEKENPTRYFE